MLKFHCHSCGEKFHISFENLYNKIGIQCQNCNHQLPPEAVKSLRDFSEAYMDTIDTLYKTGKYQKCWSISIVGTDKAIPEEVHQYSFLNRSVETTHWEHRRKPYVPDKVVSLKKTSDVTNKFVGSEITPDISDNDLPF